MSTLLKIKNLQLLVCLIWLFPAAALADLMLFAGNNNDEFLGCYDCSKYQSGSICNMYGTHGSRYSSDSIWNRYGTYGNKYSSSSPWNRYSSSEDVPILVDNNGNFYGYFTINSFRSNAFSQSQDLKRLYDAYDGDLSEIRDAICG